MKAIRSMHKNAGRQPQTWLKYSALISTVLMLAGCSGSQVMAPRYYQLAAVSEPEASITTQQRLPARLGLLPVHLAEVYQQSGVVSLPQPNRVHMADRHLWAGSLKEQLESAILRGLAEPLGDVSIQPYPWRQADRPDYQLRIRVEQLAGPLSGPVVLEIRWTLSALTSEQTQPASLQQRLRVTEPVPAQAVPGRSESSANYDAYIMALERAVQQLTRKLGQTLRTQLAASSSETAN